MKPKKISVNHYLNLKLKSNSKRYPVYVRIRFDKKQAEIKSIWPYYIIKESYAYQPTRDGDKTQRASRIIRSDLGSAFLTGSDGLVPGLTKGDFESLRYPFITQSSSGQQIDHIRSAVKREAETIERIVKYFSSLDYNIASGNTSGIINHCIKRISYVLSEYYKDEFWKETIRKKNSKFGDVLQIINHSPSYGELLDTLFKIANSDFRKYLSEFQSSLKIYKAMEQFFRGYMLIDYLDNDLNVSTQLIDALRIQDKIEKRKVESDLRVAVINSFPDQLVPEHIIPNALL